MFIIRVKIQTQDLCHEMKISFYFIQINLFLFCILRIFCEISSFFSLRLFPEWQIRPNFHKFSYQLSKRQIAEEGENDVPFWNNLFFLQTIYYSAYYILLMRHKQLNYEVADTKCVTVNQRHLTASLFKRKILGTR